MLSVCVMATKVQADSSICAAQRKSQPTSTICAIPELFANLSLLGVGEVAEFDSGSSSYNLGELCDSESLTYPDMDDTNVTKVEELGKRYIDKICRDIITSKISSEFDKEVVSFKKLPSSIYSSRQRPDIAIILDGFVILIIEIDSCSSKCAFQHTIRKAILGLVDSIRFYRLHGLCSMNEWTGFAFPKLKKKECVVQITVKFDAYCFKFFYTLQQIPKNQVRETVRSILKLNLGKHKKIRQRDLSSEHEPTESYMKLSDFELRVFGEMAMVKNVAQMKSGSSLLLKGETEDSDVNVYKFPVSSQDCTAMVLMHYIITERSHFAIHLKIENIFY